MIQKTTIATILVAFSLIFACLVGVSPIFSRKPGDVVYVDFTCPYQDVNRVTGRITTTELYGNCVRVTGQLNTGFPDRTSIYTWKFNGFDTQTIDLNGIFPPGTVPFQFDIHNATIDAFVNQVLTFFKDSVVIGQNKTQLIH